MSRQMAKRLERLEARTGQARRCHQVVVRYYGDEPAEDDMWTLVVLGAPALVSPRGASWRLPAALC
jgi:hypothetical protein